MASKPITPEQKKFFETLADDVTTLSWKWQIINGLFTDQKRVDILNKTAPSFFLACQISFADDVFLTIARITDSAKSSGRPNLVISRLVDIVDPVLDSSFTKELKRLIDHALIACKPFRTHRHKRLAHSDLDFKLKSSPELLPGITFNEIDEAIKSLQDVINTFSGHFFKSEYSFKVVESGGLKALFTYLQKGLDAFEEEKKRMLSAHGLTGR